MDGRKHSRLEGICIPVLLLLFSIGASRQTSAAEIVVGPRINLSPTTFALPIHIVDGVAVDSWEFSLSYDASDVQVNTACDPFGGDPYCSLLTGPVTEGDFFASGAPFNLLLPGFIDLDPVTLAQTGLLFGVTGVFGGFAPLPFGDGILAFVQFTILGDGNSDITVGGSAVTPVPEPGTLALFATGLLFPAAKRLSRRSRSRALLVLGTLMLVAPSAEAQTTAVGPYYATPSWNQTLACPTLANCPRFVVLSNFNGEAVLDRETGLVWERVANRPARPNWISSLESCTVQKTGGRFGWRLPTIQELLSLAIPDASGRPSLPPGHPFELTSNVGYWAATTSGFPPDGGTFENAWGVDFESGFFLLFMKNGNGGRPGTWCVRGGSGLDGQ